jgi:signal transduction histidine kinase
VSQAYFFWKLADLGRSVGFQADHVFFKFIEAQRHSLNFIFMMTVFLVSLLLMVLALFYSHKIAGPIFKLSQHLKSISKGESFEPIQFRKSDYFFELADSLNDCLRNKKLFK